MSAIKIINANEGRRDPVASDRTTVYTDGYKNLFTAGTTPSIADIVAGYDAGYGPMPAGQFRLSNVHVPGTDDLMIWINGQLLLEEDNPNGDYWAVGNQQVQLSAFWLGVLDGAPTTSKLKAIWNRALPGNRDQSFQNMQNCDPTLEGAILDNDPGGPYRTSPATPGNPLATFADLPIVVTGGGMLSMFTAGFSGDGLAGPRVDVPGPAGTAVFTPSGLQYSSWVIQAGAVVNMSTTGFSHAGIAKLGVTGRLTLEGTLNGAGAGNLGGGGGTSVGGHGLPGDHLEDLGGAGANSGGGGGSGGALNTGITNPGTSGWGRRGGNIYWDHILGGSGGVGVGGAGYFAGVAGDPGVDALGITDMPMWWLERARLQSGTGGGGGGASNQTSFYWGAGGAGGHGGLTLVVECGELDFDATGLINVSGLPGGNGGPDNYPGPIYTGAGGGGGGAGGTVVIFAKTIIDASGTITNAPGSGGFGYVVLYIASGGNGNRGGYSRFIIVKV